MFALDHKEPPAHMTINELYRAASFHDGVEKIYQGFRR
jgi:hypothetical protein